MLLEVIWAFINEGIASKAIMKGKILLYNIIVSFLTWQRKEIILYNQLTFINKLKGNILIDFAASLL